MNSTKIISGLLSVSKSKFVKTGDYAVAIASLLFGLYHVSSIPDEPNLYLGVGAILFSIVSFYLAAKRPGEAILNSLKGKSGK